MKTYSRPRIPERKPKRKNQQTASESERNIGPVLQGLLNLSGLANSNVDIDMTIPQALLFSVYHEINERWAVMGNLGRQEWSEFGKRNQPTSCTS